MSGAAAAAAAAAANVCVAADDEERDRASGYRYRSHFDEEADEADVAVDGPIEHSKALRFARTMSRALAKPGGAEARRLFGAHAVLERYGALAVRLREAHRAKKADGADGGLIAHVGKLMGWPVSDGDWAAERARGRTWAAVSRQRRRGERARSSARLGVRADDEIKAIIRGERVLARTTHRYTKWFLMYLYQRQWLACDAQVPLWPAGDDTTVCTWADVLCYDLRHRRFVLIELKTGYAFQYHTPLRNVLAARDRLPDSPYNRHQMQLGWMHAQLARELATIGQAPLDAYVLRVNSLDGVPAPFALDDWARAYFGGVYDRLNERSLERFLEPERKRAGEAGSARKRARADE